MANTKDPNKALLDLTNYHDALWNYSHRAIPRNKRTKGGINIILTWPYTQ